MKSYRHILLLLAVMVLTAGSNAQNPTPSPEPNSNVDYTVRSSIEVGYRWRDIDGSLQKYQSDQNYKRGLRIFDSSFLLESSKKDDPFDSVLVSASGWGSDPSGYLRVNIAKAGAYRYDSVTRRVSYFNNLINHVNPNGTASSLHNSNLSHHFGDHDLTIFPENDKLRFRLGLGYNRTDGPAGYTHRAYSDEFGVRSDVDLRSIDFRTGVEGEILGFNMGLTFGHRTFRDHTNFFLDGPSLGNNTANSARLSTFDRTEPISGAMQFANYYFQRTFARRLDVTGRIIYSFSESDFSLDENYTGRDNSNNQIDQDRFHITGRSKRGQTRGDLGVTFRATDSFRISNTFTFDDFDINGSNVQFNHQISRTAAGASRAPVIDNDTEQRSTSYRKYSNLIEGDYHFGSRFSLNFGYRYSKRDVAIWGFDRDLDPVTTVYHFEESENTTHSVIAGFKLKPTKDWSIFADIDHGTADNVFTRVSNYNYANFRIRSRASLNKLVFNVSAIARRNENPAYSILDPTREFINQVRTKNFSASLDWTPVQKFNLSGGYTYLQLTSLSDIRVPLTGGYQNGLSEFYIRDSYFFVDANVNLKRVAFFGSYRLSKDKGQGNRITPAFTSPNIVTSYPMNLHSPEFRVAIRLTRNVEWNVGYQYYKYKDILTSSQNYNAHLPYTSLRLYFGRSADR